MADVPLPNEVMGYILNGVCGKDGRPLLDPRHRFLAGRVCRQWHLCVTHPSATDAARMHAQAPPALAHAWAHGRLARMSVLVDCLLAGGDPGDLLGAWSDCMHGGAEAVEPIIGMAVGDATKAIDAFLRWASCLSRSLSARDWSPPLRLDDRECRAFHLMHVSRADAGDAASTIGRERRARCCLARLACRFGRADVVHALFDRYNLAHASIVFPCVDDAAARDHVDATRALLCAIADHASDTEETLRASGYHPYGIDGDEGGLLFFAMRRAFYTAARLGSIAMLRAFLTDDGDGSDDDSLPMICDASDRDALWIHRTASCLQKTGRPWETLAAAHCPDVSVFERSGLLYDPRDVGAAAIAAGRTDVIDWLAGSDHAHVVKGPDALLALLRRVNELAMPADGGWLVAIRCDAIEARDDMSFERGITHMVEIMASSEPTQAEAVTLLAITHHRTALAACIIRRWLAPAWTSLGIDDQNLIYGFLGTYIAHGRWSSIEHIVDGSAAPFRDLWGMTGHHMVGHVYADAVTMEKGSSCGGGQVRMALWLARLCGTVPRSAESDALCRDMDVPTESTVAAEAWKSWCTPSRIPTVTHQGARPPVVPVGRYADSAIAHRSLMDRMALLFSEAGLI